MRRYVSTPGILIEPIGHLWAAFSPASGETALINDESAAILEVVLECGACETADVCSALAQDSDVAAETLQDVVEASWPRLIEAGLVQMRDVGATSTG